MGATLKREREWERETMGNLDETPADAARAWMRELERDIEARTGNAHAALMEACRRGSREKSDDSR